MVGTLGLLVDDGVDKLVFNHIVAVRLPYEHQVCGVFWYGFVGLEVADDVVVVGQPFEFQVFLPDVPCAIPDVHRCSRNESQQQCKPSAVHKLADIGQQEQGLYARVGQQKQHYHGAWRKALLEVYGQHEGGGNHGDGDGQPVSGLHVGRCLEQQHRYDAQYIQQIVDAGDVNLSTGT